MCMDHMCMDHMCMEVAAGGADAPTATVAAGPAVLALAAPAAAGVWSASCGTPPACLHEVELQPEEEVQGADGGQARVEGGGGQEGGAGGEALHEWAWRVGGW